MSIESNGTFHRSLTIAALCAAIVAPLAATAAPSSGMSSGGGSGHVSSGGFGAARPPGAGSLMRPSGGGPSMRQWNAPAAPDHKIRRYRPNYDWTWFNKEPPCNYAAQLHPALAANVYGTIPASCWWQATPLWLP